MKTLRYNYMNIPLSGFFLIFLFVYSSCFAQNKGSNMSMQMQKDKIIKLPEPRHDGTISVEEALAGRRSIREYSDDPLTLSEISQLLWAAQGITRKEDDLPYMWHGDQWMGGLRTAPSAGALYPLEIYIAVGEVNGLSRGLYKYHPGEHGIIKILDDDKRADIADAALDQECIRTGAVDIIITGVYRRTAFKYGNRAERYVQIESGAVCQNIYLQAYTLGLGTVIVGAFHDDVLKSTLHIHEDEYPLGIMPVGRK